METLARFGYFTKGFIYGLIGILALLAAFSAGGKTTDTTGASQTITAQPFGKILIILIAFGIGAYALWRLFQGIKDPDNKGNIDPIGSCTQRHSLWGVAFNAALLAMGSSNSDGDSNIKCQGSESDATVSSRDS